MAPLLDDILHLSFVPTPAMTNKEIYPIARAITDSSLMDSTKYYTCTRAFLQLHTFGISRLSTDTLVCNSVAASADWLTLVC